MIIKYNIFSLTPSPSFPHRRHPQRSCRVSTIHIIVVFVCRFFSRLSLVCCEYIVHIARRTHKIITVNCASSRISWFAMNSVRVQTHEIKHTHTQMSREQRMRKKREKKKTNQRRRRQQQRHGIDGKSGKVYISPELELSILVGGTNQPNGDRDMRIMLCIWNRITWRLRMLMWTNAMGMRWNGGVIGDGEWVCGGGLSWRVLHMERWKELNLMNKNIVCTQKSARGGGGSELCIKWRKNIRQSSKQMVYMHAQLYILVFDLICCWNLCRSQKDVPVWCITFNAFGIDHISHFTMTSSSIRSAEQKKMFFRFCGCSNGIDKKHSSIRPAHGWRWRLLLNLISFLF